MYDFVSMTCLCQCHIKNKLKKNKSNKLSGFFIVAMLLCNASSLKTGKGES